jgi:hypothetical protein
MTLVWIVSTNNFPSTDSPTASARLSFDVADNLSLPAALVAYTQNQVNLTYNGTVQPINANTTTAATPIPTKTSTAPIVMLQMSLVVFILGIVAGLNVRF